ncbi:hypothetical protein FQA39_LY09375 [Lamprigera yunnana]|nr:hypothetical protein FQA39_LY09375 [Lamprigera yunnana]
MMDVENNEEKNLKKSIHSISFRIGFIFIALIFGLFGCVYLIDRILPSPLEITDEANYPDRFIAARAQAHLKSLTDIGPRVTGTPENEVRAVQFLTNTINKIAVFAHKTHKLELDIQTVSGSFYLDYKPDGAINVYKNVQNVIVKLHASSPSNHSLLVNAHFDSVATSPGGSDDGINCAIMLEVLQKLVQSSKGLEHNIVFLFNGAEETPLQASHGFITQHRWAKEVRVVVNLEAAGAGGKEILFQSGPKRPWLLKHYRKVPRPNGQAAGEELFQSGLIPSDTDFRIFRDFGNVVGLDFAFNRNGYRYHTHYDDFHNIPSGSFQHAGDNALFLIKSLVNATELGMTETQEEAPVVFFDFMTLFMISYSGPIIIVVNTLLSILSIAVAFKSFYSLDNGFPRQSLIYGLKYLLAIIISIIASALFIIINALIIDALHYSMSWYANTWIILGLYVVPVIAITYLIILGFNYKIAKSKWSISIQAQIQAHIIRIIWSVLILIGTGFGVRSVYALLFPVLFQTVSFIIIEIFRLQHSVKKWLLIYIILGTIIPNIFLMREALEIMSVIIPICGRIGSDKNSEIMIGILTLFLTILISSSYTPLITLVNKAYFLIIGLASLYILFLIFVFTPLGFPYRASYTSPAPQRFWIYHLNRKFYDENKNLYKNDSGFFLLNMDRNSPDSIKNHVPELNNAIPIEDECSDLIFCGFPIASTRMVSVLRESTWIPSSEAIIPNPIKLNLNSKINLDEQNVTYTFTVWGTNYMNVYVSARNGAVIKNISLVEELPKATVWDDRSVFLIISNNETEQLLDIIITGRYMYDKEIVKTSAYREFLKHFPEWADIYSWVGAYESWVY